MAELETTDSKMNRKVKLGGVGGGVGLGGGLAVCEVVKMAVTLSDTIESYVCLFILLVFVVSGVLGLGYITSPGENDGVKPVKAKAE